MYWLLYGESESGDRVMLPVAVCPACGALIPTTIASMDQHAGSAHPNEVIGPGDWPEG